jgi:dihydroorotase
MRFTVGALSLALAVRTLALAGPALALAVPASLALALPAAAGAAESFDLVLSGGRVIDPESGLDAVRQVGIRAGRIAAVSAEPLAGRETLEVAGLVVAPGFIDLHAHGQEPVSNALQARDGVTTALDLEIGAHPVASFYEQREGQAILHYGVSAGHIPARVDLKHGIEIVHQPTTPEVSRGLRASLLRQLARVWQPMGYAREPATPEEIERLLGIVASDLDAGGLGVGLGLDYTPGATPEEIRALFALAARRGVPAFVHMRGAVGPTDMSQIDALLEHARATGAALHVFHITSSGLARTPAYLAKMDAARAEGLDVTTEVYPYTAGSTRIESAFFDPGWQERLGISYGDLQWSETGERLTQASFERYRSRGGWVIAHSMTPEIVDAAVAHPGVLVASDGIPFLKGGEHPRGAGTFARVLGRYVRERRLLSLEEALRKMTWLPARRLEGWVPQMRAKGRIREGADADLTLFDPERVIDRATFESSREPSAGIVHVLVAGTFVVRDEALVPGVFPGQPIRIARAAPAR